MLHYRISLDFPDRHEFAVTLGFTNEEQVETRLTLPAWIPGSYMVRDFAKHLNDVEAEANGDVLAIRKLDKQTWLIPAVSGEITVSYKVYAWDESVRTAYFDRTRAFFNGTSLFLRVVGREQSPHQVYLQRPAFEEAGAWTVAATMPEVDVDDAGYGLYQTDNYQQLIDYPFEVGDLRRSAFELGDITHEMVYVDAPGADIERVSKDLKPILAEHVSMFGELPIGQYLFMTLATANGYGGLEHPDSTALICKRSDLPYANTKNADKGYRQFISLCSHEYFHLWNVKRIRPQLLKDANLSTEVNTELLWAFEGITSYYDELALPRAGFLSASEYLDMLAPSVTRYLRNAGRSRQSVAESSFDAWTKFYKQDEDAPNAIVSYYNKGALVALGLDLWIRSNSDDQQCLDDLMRRLWLHYGKTDKGIPERGIELEISEMLGKCPQSFFDAYIYGTTELPLEAWFAAFGVAMHKRTAKALSDTGGYVADYKADQAMPVSLGARVSDAGGLVRFDAVFTDGAAQTAGVSPGDLLIALDSERCTKENLSELLSRYVPGDEVELALFRRDRLQQLRLVIQAAPVNTCDLSLIDESELTEEIQQRRRRWLASVRNRAA